MTNYTNKQLLEKYNSLPKDLQNAIRDTQSKDAVQAIGKKYGLNLESTGMLDNEVVRLILGISRPGDFVKNLSENLGTDLETSKKIAAEINEQIFSKVRESLKKIHGVENEGQLATSKLATSQKPEAGGQKPADSPQSPAPSPQSPVPGPQHPAPSPQSQAPRVSPFEEKLKNSASLPSQVPPNQNLEGAPIKQELERAKEENRYPQGADPYKEPPK